MAEDLQADAIRIAKLKELAGSGMIDRQASYFNHLIDVYGNLDRKRTNRTFTEKERERIDLFLESFIT